MSIFRFFFCLFKVLFKLGIVTVLAGAIGLVAYTAFWLPDVNALVDKDPETTAFIKQAVSRLRIQGRNPQITQKWIPLDKISDNLVQAVLVSEDDRFYEHQGVDLTEVWNSLKENLKARRWVRGGSTLTQQLAKNLYLTPEKNLYRKFDELILALKLERTLTKKRILELYLNVVEWGGCQFGAEAASQHYFNKPASELTLPEAIKLAALLPNPDFLNSHGGRQRLLDRQRDIVDKLTSRPPKARHTQLVKPTSSSPTPPKVIPATPSMDKGKTVAQHMNQLGSGLRDKVGQITSRIDQNPTNKNTQVQAPEEPPQPLGTRTSHTGQSTAQEGLSHQSSPNHIDQPPSNPSGIQWHTLKPNPTPSGETSSKIQTNPPPRGEDTKPVVDSRSRKLRDSLSRLEKILGK